MKKRIINKYFSQIKKNRKNVRLERKIGKKQMLYLYKNRNDIFPHNVWGDLLRLLFDGNMLFGG